MQITCVPNTIQWVNGRISLPLSLRTSGQVMKTKSLKIKNSEKFPKFDEKNENEECCFFLQNVFLYISFIVKKSTCSTYLPACLHACIPVYLPICLHTCLPAYICQHTCLPNCLPTYMPAYLPTYMPAYLPPFLPACLPTYH